MSMLTATKKTNIEDDAALLSTVTTNSMLSQLRADSDYDEEDDELTTRPTPTGSPPPVSVTTANSADSDDDEIMASSPPPQSSSAGLPGGNMTPATGAPPAADVASGGGTSSYHIPQFPIERIESKMAAISSSLAKEMDEKRAAAAALGYPQSTMNKDDRQLYGDGVSISAQSLTTAGIEKQLPSTAGAQWQQNLSEDNEGQYDFVPHFQRVSIGGEDNNGVPLEDLHWASQQLMEALHIRERYMRVSHQSFPNITSKFFHKKHPKSQGGDPSSPSSGNASVLHSSDSISDVSAGGDSNNKTEIRQPYPRARVIKHEDRQSIADIRKRVSVSDLGTQQSRKSSYNPWADRRSSTMDDAFTDQLLFDIAYGQYGACVRV
jgi:AMP deaminase